MASKLITGKISIANRAIDNKFPFAAQTRLIQI